MLDASLPALNLARISLPRSEHRRELPYDPSQYFDKNPLQPALALRAGHGAGRDD
jgi:hypothetical protein